MHTENVPQLFNPVINISVRKQIHLISLYVTYNYNNAFIITNLLCITSIFYRNLSQDDYLLTSEGFFKSKNNVYEYSSIYYRILNIVMFMLSIGKWGGEKQSKDMIICNI